MTSSEYKHKRAKNEAETVIEAEREKIKLRRRRCGLAEGNPASDSVGLALSGGGVRSATYNLGLLQALHEADILKRVDYLSTVSGGGYIGASLTRHLNYWPTDHDSSGGTEPPIQTRFPFPRDKPEDPVVPWLRSHASYLTPGRGLNGLALAAAIIRGVLVSLLILGPILLAAMWLLAWRWPDSLDNGARPWVILLLGLGGLPAFYYAVIYKLTEYHRETAEYRKGWEAFAWLLTIGIGVYFLYGIPPDNAIWSWPPACVILLVLGLGFLIKYVVGNILLTGLSTTRGRLAAGGYAYFSAEYGYLLGFALLFGFFGSLPWIYQLLTSDNVNKYLEFNQISAAITAGGSISTAIGWAKRGKKGELSNFTMFFVQLGLALLVFALVVGLFHVADLIHRNYTIIGNLVLIVIGLIASLATSLVADINYVSMHRYYGDRLLDTYLRSPDKQEDEDKKKRNDASEYCMKDIDVTKSGAPYPIINCNLVTTGSTDIDTRYRLRRGDNFIFSPLYIGANATGYADNQAEYRLATAMAVSGAAVDPHTGEAHSWALRFLMSLLNVRLGYWILHPRHFGPRKAFRDYVKDSWWNGSWDYVKDSWWNFFRDYVQGSWLWLILTEIMRGPREDTDFIRLSDGGHFENLGLYELVRRKCQWIIVSDAGADKNWKFGDIARAIERVRVDFGAEVNIDLGPLIPDGTSGNSARPFSIGSIIYNDKTKSRGTIIYVKTTLFCGLPADVFGYRSANQDFPNESTLNQFFTEVQFEAYRELGYQAGKTLLESIEWIFATRNMGLKPSSP